MEPRKLSDLPAARSIFDEIKDLIPETRDKGLSRTSDKTVRQAEVIQEDIYGNRTYGGKLLEDKISSLIREMNVGEDWKGRLVYWPKNTKLLNDRKQGYLIPLYDIFLNPGGALREGDYIYITNEPVLSAGAAAISLYLV